MTQLTVLLLAWAISGTAAWIACLMIGSHLSRRHQLDHLTHALRSAVESARATLPESGPAVLAATVPLRRAARRGPRVVADPNRSPLPALGGNVVKRLFAPGSGRST